MNDHDPDRCRVLEHIIEMDGKPTPMRDDYVVYDGEWTLHIHEKREATPPFNRPGTNSFENQTAWCEVVGIDPHRVSQYLIRYWANTQREYREYQLVAEEPFGVFQHDVADRTIGSAYFEAARQAVNGEPCKTLQLPKPHFTRGTMGWRWIKLTELGKFIDQDPFQLWCDYHTAAIGKTPVLYHDEWERQRGCGRRELAVTLDTCASDLFVVDSDLGSSVVAYTEWQQHQISEYLHMRSLYERVWVPAGWAMNVLYLRRFNYLTWSKQRDKAAQLVENDTDDLVLD